MGSRDPDSPPQARQPPAALLCRRSGNKSVRANRAPEISKALASRVFLQSKRPLALRPPALRVFNDALPARMPFRSKRGGRFGFNHDACAAQSPQARGVGSGGGQVSFAPSWGGEMRRLSSDADGKKGDYCFSPQENSHPSRAGLYENFNGSQARRRAGPGPSRPGKYAENSAFILTQKHIALDDRELGPSQRDFCLCLCTCAHGVAKIRGKQAAPRHRR